MIHKPKLTVTAVHASGTRKNRKEKSVNTEDATPDAPKVTPDPLALAEVGYAVGQTINLGNFESLRIDVSLKMPSRPRPASIEKTFKFAVDWVDSNINTICDEVKKSL